MPKRVNNIFKENITFSKLLEAHNKCKKNKRFKKQVIEFEINLERNIIELGRDLISGRYIFSKYFEFTIYEPKERKIKTLNYKDRVILCWYVENFLKPYYKPNFIEDSYACLEGKGTHKAIKKTVKYLINASKFFNTVWILKCDIKKFFFNIDRNILFSMVSRKIKDKHFLEFSKKIIFYDKEKVGIPIGNYSSQYFANIYMTSFDKFIKEKLKIKYYIRFMDDFVLLFESKEKARKGLIEIKNYLSSVLKLELNSKTSYFRESQGINFLGYRIWKTHLLIRNQSKKKIKRKLKNFQKLYKENKIELEYITACINSWKGYAKFGNSYNLINKILGKFVLTK